MTVSGNFWMGNSTTVNMTSLATLNINGIAYFSGTLIIQLLPQTARRSIEGRNVVAASQVSTTAGSATTTAPSNLPGGSRQQTFVVAQYSSAQGQFSSASLNFNSACETVTASSISYGTTRATLSVTLQPTNAAGCPSSSQGSLSAGAIVGIVIGCVVAVVLITVLALSIAKRKQQQSVDAIFSRAKKHQMETEMSSTNLKPNPAHQNVPK